MASTCSGHEHWISNTYTTNTRFEVSFISVSEVWSGPVL